MDGIPEEIIQKKIIQSWVLVKGSLHISKEPGPDDASTPPHEGNATIIQVPSKLLGCLPEQHEPLGVGHDLAGVQGLADGFNKFFLISFIFCILWAMEDGASLLPFILER